MIDIKTIVVNRFENILFCVSRYAQSFFFILDMIDEIFNKLKVDSRERLRQYRFEEIEDECLEFKNDFLSCFDLQLFQSEKKSISIEIVLVFFL